MNVWNEIKSSSLRKKRSKILALLSETTQENCEEVGGKNRSVMPLDVLGCTRVTMIKAESEWEGRKERGRE